MDYMRHLHFANNANLEEFLPYYWQGRQIGWIRKDRLDQLADWPEAFKLQADRVLLAPKRDDYDRRSAILAEATTALREAGHIKQWWDEIYPVSEAFGKSPIADIERGACPYLGIRSWGVHMNGYIRKKDGLYLWVAERSPLKQNYPGMLDNMVAGGQPKGLGLKENMQKECQEEAGIPLEITQNLQPAGTISYRHQFEHGLKPDTVFVFDLEVPEDFQPVIVDGEAAGFQLLPVEDVMDLVRNTDKIKYNCNLVYIDFFIRHGYLTADSEPDYAEICKALRQ